MKFSIKHMLLILVLLVIVAVPVMAYQQDFQNTQRPLESFFYYWGDPFTSSTSNVTTGYNEDNPGYADTELHSYQIEMDNNDVGAIQTAIVYFNYDSPESRSAWSVVMINPHLTGSVFAWNWYFAWFDAGQNVVGTYQTPADDTHRYDFYYTTGHILCYRDGAYFADVGAVAGAPKYFAAGGYLQTFVAAGTFHFGMDDVIVDTLPVTGNQFTISEAMPNVYYIAIDPSNSANNGMYAIGSDVVVNSNWYYNRYSAFDNGSKIWSVRDATTKQVYESLAIAGSHGVVRGNITNLSSASSGLYETYIDTPPLDGVSSQFWLTSVGARVSWDRDAYSPDDVAIISYNITPASYWDTATYWYYLRVLDQSLATKYSTSITSSSGSQSISLDTSYTDSSVYYATVYKVKKSDSTESLMGYDYMEMDYDTVIAGTCYNATSGAVMTGVNVSVAQGAIQTFSMSDPAYRLSGATTGAALYLNASYNGYQNYSFVFTPLRAKTYTIDIPMVSSDLTYFTAVVGGVVYSTPYRQPIANALVTIMNATHYTSELTTSTGWYTFSGLLDNGTYWVQASKSGYAIGGNESIIAQVP